MNNTESVQSVLDKVIETTSFLDQEETHEAIINNGETLQPYILPDTVTNQLESQSHQLITNDVHEDIPVYPNLIRTGDIKRPGGVRMRGGLGHGDSIRHGHEPL